MVLHVDDFLYGGIHLAGGFLTVVLSPGKFLAKKDQILLVAEGDHPQFTHAPVAHHVAGDVGSHTDVACGAAGNVTNLKFLGGASAHGATDLVQDPTLAVVQNVFLGREHSAAETLPSRNNCYLVDG